MRTRVNVNTLLMCHTIQPQVGVPFLELKHHIKAYNLGLKQDIYCHSLEYFGWKLNSFFMLKVGLY